MGLGEVFPGAASKVAVEFDKKSEPSFIKPFKQIMDHVIMRLTGRDVYTPMPYGSIPAAHGTELTLHSGSIMLASNKNYKWY